MKKSGIGLLIGLLIGSFVFSLTCLGEELKIGYVELEEVLTNYEKAKEYDQLLTQRREEIEEELSKEREMIKEMQEGLSLLKEDERKKQEEKIGQAIAEYREKERRVILEFRRERYQKLQEILEDINKIIVAYAKKKGIDLILNKETVVYFSDKIMNLTQDIIKIANEKAVEE